MSSRKDDGARGIGKALQHWLMARKRRGFQAFIVRSAVFDAEMETTRYRSTCAAMEAELEDTRQILARR